MSFRDYRNMMTYIFGCVFYMRVSGVFTSVTFGIVFVNKVLWTYIVLDLTD